MLMVTGKYCKIWSIERKEKSTRIKLGTSEKNQDGTFKNSVWFATFIGDAHKNSIDLKEKDVVNLVSAKVSNIYDKNKNTNFLNLTVFKFEKVGGEAQASGMNTEIDDGDFPF